MNNSKTLVEQEVYVKSDLPTRLSVCVWSSRLGWSESQANVEPQSGYLLSREELEAFAREMFYGGLEKLNLQILFNQLVTPK